MEINLFLDASQNLFPYCPHCNATILSLKVSNHSGLKEDGSNIALTVYSCPMCNKVIGVSN